MIITQTIYGIGGWCEVCHPSHKHPHENIIEVIETEVPGEVTE